MSRDTQIILAVLVSALLVVSGWAMTVVVIWGAVSVAILLSPVIYVLSPVFAIAGMSALIWFGVPYLDAVPHWLVGWFVGALALVFAGLMIAGRVMVARADRSTR